MTVEKPGMYGIKVEATDPQGTGNASGVLDPPGPAPGGTH